MVVKEEELDGNDSTESWYESENENSSEEEGEDISKEDMEAHLQNQQHELVTKNRPSRRRQLSTSSPI